MRLFSVNFKLRAKPFTLPPYFLPGFPGLPHPGLLHPGLPHFLAAESSKLKAKMTKITKYLNILSSRTGYVGIRIPNDQTRAQQSLLSKSSVFLHTSAFINSMSSHLLSKWFFQRKNLCFMGV